MQEQRNFCDACQVAVADKQHAEVIRLLRTRQIGMQIRDDKMAWQLLKVKPPARSASIRRLCQHFLESLTSPYNFTLRI